MNLTTTEKIQTGDSRMESAAQASAPVHTQALAPGDMTMVEETGVAALSGSGARGSDLSASASASDSASAFAITTPISKTTVSKRGILLRTALAVLSGVMIFSSYPNGDIWPLAWLGMLPLMAAMENQTPRSAFRYGMLMGLVTNLGGFYWIYGLLITFGHLPMAIAALLCLLLCAYQGLRFGLWAMGSRLLESSVPWKRAVLRLALFVALEFSIPFIFPWYLGNSQYKFLPAIQVAELFGVLGISSLVMIVNIALYETGFAIVRRKPLPATLLATSALIVCSAMGFGVWRLAQVEQHMEAAPSIKVGVVEGNIGIGEKENPAYVKANLLIHQRISQLLSLAGADLIVWPESAYDSIWVNRERSALKPSSVPLREDPAWDNLSFNSEGILKVPDPLQVPVDYRLDTQDKIPRSQVNTPQRGFRTPIMLGAVTWAENPNPSPAIQGIMGERLLYNSALLLDEDGQIAGNIYDKNYRLVFGEYLPLGETFPQLYEMIPAAGSFAKGETITTFTTGKARIAPLICYEGILPAFVRKFTTMKPNLLVNVTNDAWFGKTSEPWLHLALTTIRSVENRLAMVRNTNTGISAVIEPTGRIAVHTELEGAEAILRDVPLMEHNRRTLYQVIGDLVGWLGIILCVLAGVKKLYTTRSHKNRAPERLEKKPAPAR